MYKEAKGFFADVDYFCISDNYWSAIASSPHTSHAWPTRLGTKKPCITYGLRGIVYFMACIVVAAAMCGTHSVVQVEVEGSAKDLHSGVFGGVVHEPSLHITPCTSDWFSCHCSD